MRAECFIAETLGPRAGACEGRLQRAHLIKQQTIRRAVQDATRGDPIPLAPTALGEILLDPRSWRPVCELHHHRLDKSRTVRLSWEQLPEETVEFAREYGLLWWLSREYGA